MDKTEQRMSGTPAYSNCTLYSVGQPSSTGCGVNLSGNNNYGSGLNKNSGGIYTLLWDDAAGMQLWFFPRNAIPQDLQQVNSTTIPTPEKWGTPTGHYPLGKSCDTKAISQMRIIINLTFCGGWAGSANSYKNCPGTSCNSFVENNPSAFDESYWDINYLKVYQQL